MSISLTSKLVAEFIGTLAFVFIGAGAAAVLGGFGLSGIASIVHLGLTRLVVGRMTAQLAATPAE
jgi:glycerol uptake facilitator-like aquaporin